MAALQVRLWTGIPDNTVCALTQLFVDIVPLVHDKLLILFVVVSARSVRAKARCNRRTKTLKTFRPERGSAMVGCLLSERDVHSAVLRKRYG